LDGADWVLDVAAHLFAWYRMSADVRQMTAGFFLNPLTPLLDILDRIALLLHARHECSGSTPVTAQMRSRRA
jgi:hypothetical protein